MSSLHRPALTAPISVGAVSASPVKIIIRTRARSGAVPGRSVLTTGSRTGEPGNARGTSTAERPAGTSRCVVAGTAFPRSSASACAKSGLPQRRPRVGSPPIRRRRTCPDRHHRPGARYVADECHAERRRRDDRADRRPPDRTRGGPRNRALNIAATEMPGPASADRSPRPRGLAHAVHRAAPPDASWWRRAAAAILRLPCHAACSDRWIWLGRWVPGAAGGGRLRADRAPVAANPTSQPNAAVVGLLRRDAVAGPKILRGQR